jgi:DNA-binding transcriptional regulator GbsR (MarR family)
MPYNGIFLIRILVIVLVLDSRAGAESILWAGIGTVHPGQNISVSLLIFRYFQYLLKIMNERHDPAESLALAQDQFISQWGAIGGAWGINRTMAQVHALLMTSKKALTTDEVMAALKISRGNAHQNLRELVGWGLVRNVIRKGERKEYYESEKDVWRMCCIVVRERKRREIEPALRALRACEEQTRPLRGEQAVTFNRQIKALLELLGQMDAIMDRVSQSEQSTVMPLLLKLLGKRLK